MKNDDDFIHLPELYIKLSALKKHLQKTYKLNINPMKNSDKNVNWSDLNKNLNAGYDDEKMAMISCDIIHEYAVKLDKVVKEDTELEEWVKSKIAKTEQMMASVKHALIGIEKYDHGGELFKQQLLHIGKYAQAIIEVLQDGTELMSWMESNLAVCADHMDNVYHHLDYKMGNRAKDLDKMKNGGGVRESENFKGKINKDIKYVFVSDTFDSYLGNIPKIEFFKDYESAKKSYIKYLMDSNNYMGNWTMALYECDDDCSIYSQDNTKKVKNAKKLHRFEGSNRYVDGKIIDSVNEKNKNFIVNLIDENNEYKNGGGVSETPIAMMREVTGKSVGTVPVSEEIYSSQVNDFVNYVYEVYAEQGYTKAQVKTAVNKYIKDLGKEFTYGGGDSLDRERVYEYLLNPSLKGIKNPMMRDGGGIGKTADEVFEELTEIERVLYNQINNLTARLNKVEDILRSELKSIHYQSYNNGGNVGRDAMFRSQEPHEQRYDRKREYKEYKKEGWLANDWFDNGGGVGYFKSGYTLKGRKGKYWIDDVEGRVTKDRYFEKEEDAIAEIDLLSRFKKLKNEQRVKGPSMENLMEADRYYAEGGGVTKD